MLGKRVAVATQEGDGTWQQYLVMPALRCIALQDGVTTEQGASLLSDPAAFFSDPSGSAFGTLSGFGGVWGFQTAP